MRRKSRAVWLLLMCMSLFMLTGCWDYEDIEDHYMEVGEAIDKTEESMVPDSEELKKKPLTLTVQYILPEIMSGKKGGPGQKPYENVTKLGDSLFEMWDQLFLKLDRPFFISHLKVIVIGEEVARHYNLQQILINYSRPPEVRGSGVILIAKGRASDVFHMADPTAIPAFRLNEIAQHQDVAARILSMMTTQKVTGKMAGDSSFLLQSVVSEKGELKFAGGAVIKGKINKLIGFFTEEELKVFNWLTGEAKVGMIEAIDKQSKQKIVLETQSVKSKIKPHVQGEQISFDVMIDIEGRLNEDWVFPGNAFDKEFMKRSERAIETKLRKQLDQILNKMQKEYQVDVGGFGNQLRIQEPKVWKKVKKDWDKQFSKVPVKFHVNVLMQEFGTTGTKKK